MLAPFTPHVADHLWELLGKKGFLVRGPWPAFDPAIAREDEVTLAVQVNGKVRDQITVPAGASEDEVLAAAKSSAKVRVHLDGKSVVRELVVPGRIVNLVVK
jgi:leucyl-tRNA synthetase